MKPSSPRTRVVAFESCVPYSSPSARTALGEALGRCSQPQRAILALRLVERLTSAEAAASLGITVRQFERAYHALILDLRRIMIPFASDPAPAPARMRKVS